MKHLLLALCLFASPAFADPPAKPMPSYEQLQADIVQLNQTVTMLKAANSALKQQRDAANDQVVSIVAQTAVAQTPQK